jgi:acyl-coenzyme A thioesterase PaaI-like protein
MREIVSPYDYSECFFCGGANPIGLKLKFYVSASDPKEVICRWKPPALYLGLGRVLHGGIQSGIFDEIMGWTAMHLTEKVGVTSWLKVQFLKPLFVQQDIEARCSVSAVEGASIILAAEIRDESNMVCTETTGSYILMERDRFERLVRVE